jgi:MFS family permease
MEGIYWNIFSTIPTFRTTLNDALIISEYVYDVRKAEYILPAVVGFFSGVFINKLGPRYSLLIGCVGYPLKLAAYLCFEYIYSQHFMVFAGIILAICQGISGSVVPYMMLAYPAERFKGISIGLFLVIWSFCAFVGALVSSSTFTLCIAPDSDLVDRYCSRKLISRH